MSQSVKDYYNKNAKMESERLDGGLCKIEFASTLGLIDRYFPKQGRVCDIGGGPGRYSIELLRRGYQVTLFDISVDDDIVGHICDIPELDPGESVKCTADYTIPEDANISITNVVVAVGEDENGTEVSDEDEVTILVILGTTVTPTPTVTPPGGVAFTGTGVLVPLAGLALLLLTLGTGLLWWGRRRGSREHA